MRCPRCQRDNPPHAKSCLECGAPLALTCARCGTELPASAKFCFQCAHPVGAPVAGFALLASPEAYTPRHLAEKILTSRSALEGERKQVTVLFCDLANSTALAERLGPEGMHGLLNRFFELALAEVHRYEGTINQFLGDGFMALFGAPVAHEDHTRRAILAALGLQRALRERRPEFALPEGIELAVRMGLNTGPVVVGKIGDDLRMDYTAVGDATHLAARLQQLAEPGAILLSEATHGLVEAYVESTCLGEREVKGLGPQRVYRVEALKPGAARFDAALRRGLSPLVGRRQELAALELAYREAQAGALRVVDLVGEAGIGKSRLLYEFRQRLAGEPAFILEGHCASFGRATPFLPFIEVVRTAFELAEGDAVSEVERKLRRGLEFLGMGPERALPFLLNLLGLDPGPDAFRGLDGEIIGARTRDVLQDLLRARCRLSATVLVLDDLHWMDSASEELLLRLIRGAGAQPLLVAGAFRPEYRPPWAGQAEVAELTLPPLSEESCVQLVQQRLGTETLPEPVTRLIVDKAEGNPLFAEELTRYLMERGGLGRTEKGVSVRADAARLAVPGSLQDLVMARVDRLPEGARVVLQVASVIGRRFSSELVQTVAEVEGHLPQYLHDLEAQELIFRQGVDGREEYIFKHALIQEAVYGSLLTARRAVLHAQVADAIERSYGDRLGEWAEVLAHHWGQTPRVEKTVHHLALAGEKSLRVYAVEDAHGHFQRAAELLETHPGCANDSFLADMVLAWARACYYRKDFNGIIGLTRYLPRIEALGDHRRLSLLLFWLSLAHWSAARYDVAESLWRKALGLAEALGDDECIGYASMGLMWLYEMKPSGERRNVVGRFARRGLEIAERLKDIYLASNCLSGLCAHEVFRGSFQRAQEFAMQTLELGRRSGDPRTISVGLYLLASIHFGEERFDEALESAEEALRVSPDPLDRVASRLIKGLALAFQGAAEEGVAIAREALDGLRAGGQEVIAAWWDVPFGGALVLSGRMAAGVRWIENAIRQAEVIGNGAIAATGHVLLGEIYLQMIIGAKPVPFPILLKNLRFIATTLAFARRRARRHLERAVQRAREADLPGFLARALFDLGVLSKASKHFDEARRCLKEAHRLAEPNSATLSEKIRQALASLP